MKNLDKLTTREEIRAAIVSVKTNHEALKECYTANINGTPAETVAALVEKIGYAAACETVAEAVNAVGEWDGRIYPKSRAWAEGVENAASREELERCRIYSGSIHSAHVDQIAAAMAAYAPVEGETEATEATESTEAVEGEEITTAAEIIATARQILDGRKRRSAWGRGVALYESEFLDTCADAAERGCIDRDDICNRSMIERAMLDGASDWSQYSWCGCSLIYDKDIAKRLCTPSELRKTRNGKCRPNAREEWLDVQERALYQAAEHVILALLEAQKN